MPDANKPSGLFFGDGFCYRFSPLRQRFEGSADHPARDDSL